MGRRSLNGALLGGAVRVPLGAAVPTLLIAAARALLIGAALASSACSSVGVRPWQHETLARDEMQLNADSLDRAIDDHLYFSKEAAAGGRSFAGGGCGCN